MNKKKKAVKLALIFNIFAILVLFVLLIFIGKNAADGAAAANAALPDETLAGASSAAEDEGEAEPAAQPVALPEPEPALEPPEEPEPKEIRESFKDLRKKYSNDDIVGYILIEGTSVDYPVAHYGDNDFYLTRNLYKKEDKEGSIFLDYENNTEEFTRNTVIYGHNMKTDTMFHALRFYRTESYFKKHPHIILKTPYEDTLWEIFSFMKAPVSLNYLQAEPNRAQFAKLLEQINELSLYDTGVGVTADDKILNLSTCSVDPSETMYRYVVSAKLIERVPSLE